MRVRIRTSPTGQPRSVENGGFTLLELTLVLLIAGLLFSLVTIRLEGAIFGGDLGLASRMIAGEVKRLRGLAAHTRTPQVMVLDMEEGRLYQLKAPDPQEKEFGEEMKKRLLNVRELPPGVFVEDVLYPAKGKVQDGKAEIRFFENGCIERSLIHLRNEKDQVHTLEINPLTGEVVVHDRYFEQKEK